MTESWRLGRVLVLVAQHDPSYRQAGPPCSRPGLGFLQVKGGAEGDRDLFAGGGGDAARELADAVFATRGDGVEPDDAVDRMGNRDGHQDVGGGAGGVDGSGDSPASGGGFVERVVADDQGVLVPSGDAAVDDADLAASHAAGAWSFSASSSQPLSSGRAEGASWARSASLRARPRTRH